MESQDKASHLDRSGTSLQNEMCFTKEEQESLAKTKFSPSISISWSYIKEL